MIASGISIACFICALIPACLFLLNLWFFREPTKNVLEAAPRIDVLLPARNEGDNIEVALHAVLASSAVDLRIFVYDDSSTDETAAIVASIAAIDSRVRLLRGNLLPEGWNGKQHACWQLALTSTAPLILFLDADVRLEPEAIARCIAQQQRRGVALLSGFPQIVMVTWLELMLLPLIQFVLMGLLPMFRMRHTTKPAYAAGCGQFMLVDRAAYLKCGGHAAIRQTRHDGLKLPHLFREHGLKTDICDLTKLAHVRMYRSAADVWNGLAKNSTEGLGSPGRIVPISLLLLFGQVLPAAFIFVILIRAMTMLLSGSYPYFAGGAPMQIALLLVALFASSLPSFYASWRFKQPWRSALLHPVGVLLLLVLQWYALARQLVGKPVGWRARSYSSTTGQQVS